MDKYGYERRTGMIQISSEAVRTLMDKAGEGFEVHMRFTEEETEIEIMPWKPFEMKCPYGYGKENRDERTS